jgi:hypothetical protein
MRRRRSFVVIDMYCLSDVLKILIIIILLSSTTKKIMEE